MMIFSLVAMTGLEKCCITSAYMQWFCYSGEQPVAHGPLVLNFVQIFTTFNIRQCICGRKTGTEGSVLQVISLVTDI